MFFIFVDALILNKDYINCFKNKSKLKHFINMATLKPRKITLHLICYLIFLVIRS